ncbi:hypothetical protein MMC26_003783 [Xylographa opegraphella]|nr:hypothetical protein [Xylographa opegraphella]
MAQPDSQYDPPSTMGPGTSYFRAEALSIRTIGVEEHIMFPQLMSRIPKDSHAAAIMKSMMSNSSVTYSKSRTTNGGEQRIKNMDEGGVAMQILSSVGLPNCTHLGDTDPKGAVELAREINDELKKVVDSNPTRFKAFAELPMHDPEASVAKLHRCVKEMGFVGAMLSGTIGGSAKFLDGPEFDPILSAFEELDVPLYLHPAIPPKAVWDKYYAIDDKPDLSAAFGLAGWGWHNEVAIHVIRLAISGTLDKHRKLKIIVGYQGEMMPMMMQRFDTRFPEKEFGFERSVGEMLRSQVWIAVSGMFSLPPTQAAIATWGVDRVLFAADYPFQNTQRVPEYLKALGDVVAPSDLRKICQTNAEALLKFKV